MASNTFGESLSRELSTTRMEHQHLGRETREEVQRALTRFGEMYLQRMQEIIAYQEKEFSFFKQMINESTALTERRLKLFQEANEKSLTAIKETVEERLESIRQDNNVKLEKMRETVDEKLQSTLTTRLGESFDIVSKRLEEVHRGLGEMQTLAQGVGDLKRVLSNVKTRGIFGEVQLRNILKEILTKDQYEENIPTKPHSSEVVEFAIKFPGRDEVIQHIYLPIDAKFPLTRYEELLCAIESGDKAKIDMAGRDLENAIKKCAKDINEKYIDPPYTTDFGIMFLPIEGLYAEIARRNGLLEELQRQYRIIIAGPTTFSALLNSLHMGFRTLAIEKRSSEVWRVLGAVKTEFGKFGQRMDHVKEKLQQATTSIDQVGRRTRAMERKLRQVEELPQQEVELYLDNLTDQELQ